jgi:O-antigen/teichoic acid export membrane protein
VTAAVTDAEGDRPAPGQGLRRRTVRGTVVNATFLVGVNGINAIRGLVVAALLTATDFGVWGILAAITAALLFFKQVGFGDKYVQQDEADQEVEFQRMMTLELGLGFVAMALGAVAIPVVALAYGTNEILAPGFLMLLELPALALQAPVYLFYRRMDFVRQRRLQAVDPLVGFAVTIALAIAGAGYWSLVAGALAGGWAGAIVTLRACPYPLRWRFEREALARYTRFTGPLLVGGVAAIVVTQAILLSAQRSIGLAAVGAITLAGMITGLARRADDIVTNTLYPAIVAAIDRKDLLVESFVKSNRLVVMWAVPFGVGLSLFASDLVRFGLGSRWEHAIVLLELSGVAVALHQVGFNWDAFYRAAGRTGPIGWASVYGLVVALALPVPLLLAYGLTGLGWGLLGTELLLLAQRSVMLRRFFGDFRMTPHLVRSLLPTVPAVAVVLVPRALGLHEGNLAGALGAMAVYAVVTIAFTWLTERDLLREVIGHLRPARTA